MSAAPRTCAGWSTPCSLRCSHAMSCAADSPSVSAGRTLEEALAEPAAREELAPRAHGFFSQGRTITVCARSVRSEDPHLSERGEATCARCHADGVEDVPAFPIVFCAGCGQEYLVAAEELAEGGGRLVPREFESAEVEEADRPVYVFPEAWDPDAVPPDPSHVKQDGTARKHREGGVPVNTLLCGRCGALGGSCEHRTDTRAVASDPEAILVLCVVRGRARAGARVQQVPPSRIGRPGDRDRCADLQTACRG